MKVFISWSGALSHRIALILRDWLPDVLQAVEPYVSSEDLRKGNRWAIEIANELEVSDHGILCLTKDNLEAPWILFEAGVLSKSVGATSLWTVLVDVTNAEIEGPLAQFQHTALAHDDFKRLIHTINMRLDTAQLPDARLDRIFEKFWPELESRVSEAIQTASKPAVVRPSRSEKAMIEEILEISRSTSKAMAELKAADVVPTLSGAINWRTTVTLVPGQDENLITDYRDRCRSDLELRKYGIVGTGGGGSRTADGRMESRAVWIQSYQPPSKTRLLQIAKEVGIETIDVTYSRLGE